MDSNREKPYSPDMNEAALKSIDDAPLNKFHIKMTVLTFGAHLTAGYVMGSIAFALVGLTSMMEVSPVWQGLLGSSALIGVFTGSILTGLVADRFGRQKIFLWSFIVIALATAAQYLAVGPASLFVLRVIVGMAIGADYSVGITLLTEVLPRKYRGPLLGTLVAVWTLGYVLGSVVGAYLITSPEQWNLLLATACIPAIIVLFLRMGTPESPRWLVRVGRREEAQAIVDKFIGPGYTVIEEPVVEEKRSYGAIFSKKYLKLFIFTCAFWSFNVIPYFGIYTFLPVILEEFGMQSTTEVDMLLNLALLAGAVLGIWLIAKMTRRSFAISTSIIAAVGLFLLAVLPSGTSVIQVAVFAVFTITMAAQGDLTPVYPSEVFPTEVRSTAVGLVTGVSRIASAIGTFLLPVLIASIGLSATLGVLGGICALGAVICIAWAPETKNLVLADASGQEGS